MGGEDARVSVVLPPRVDVPARHAVPVEVRLADRSLAAYLPADGRYHEVPSGEVTFIAHLPEGQAFQASTTLDPGGRARVTLQGDTSACRARPVTPQPLELQRAALRFFVQSSLDSSKLRRRSSLGSTLLESADELRLELTKYATGVQFLQLTASVAFPMNIAHAAGGSVKLVRVDSRLAADIVVADERVELALAYLEHGRVRDAETLLRMQRITLEAAEREGDIMTAVVLLFLLLATGENIENRRAVEGAALRLANRHPDVSDFHVIAAECAALDGRNDDALAQLAELQRAGLPLLHRSFARALRRLSDAAATGFVDAGDRAAMVTAVYARLEETAPYVDPASRMLVVTGRAPDKPGEVPLWRRVGAPLRRFAVEQGITVHPTKKEDTPMVTSPVLSAGEEAGSTDAANADEAKTTGGPPAKLALGAAVAALALWIGFAIYLMAKSGSSETEWTRIAWVFASVEAIAFAAAGLLFGATVNRQRAEQAEQRANVNQKDAEGGRALAAALKADEPAVVHEGGPRALGEEDAALNPDVGLAARHARLARQLFP
jgi:hypothetical protein